MKLLFVVLLLALIIWACVMAYTIEIQIGIHCGLSRDLMIDFYWVSLACIILSALIRNSDDD
jgi:hypothetical protein